MKIGATMSEDILVEIDSNLALPGFGGHLIRGDDGLGGDDHDSQETEVFEGVQARNGQAGQGRTALD